MENGMGYVKFSNEDKKIRNFIIGIRTIKEDREIPGDSREIYH